LTYSTSDIVEKIELASAKAPVGSIWLHFKSGCYIVTGHSLDTENGATLISYRRIGGPGFNAIDEAKVVFSRPVLSWFSKNDAGVDRFTRIS